MKTLAEHDADIKAMEEKFGGKWQELCLDLVDVPCGHALDLLWKDIILSKDPDYGDWEYPGQAYRHLLAEYRDMERRIAVLKEKVESLRQERDRLLLDAAATQEGL